MSCSAWAGSLASARRTWRSRIRHLSVTADAQGRRVVTDRCRRSGCRRRRTSSRRKRPPTCAPARRPARWVAGDREDARTDREGRREDRRNEKVTAGARHPARSVTIVEEDASHVLLFMSVLLLMSVAAAQTVCCLHRCVRSEISAMQRAQLRFGKGFRVALGNQRSQAAQMVIAPGDAEGGPDNAHGGADQWLYVVAGQGTAIVNGKRHALRPGSLLLIERGDKHVFAPAAGARSRRSTSICRPPILTPATNCARPSRSLRNREVSHRPRTD